MDPNNSASGSNGVDPAQNKTNGNSANQNFGNYPSRPIDIPPTEKKPLREKRVLNIPAILAVVMLVLAIALGALAIVYINKYNKAQTNVNQQKNEAAEIAKAEQKKIDEKAFAEASKKPFRTYQAPAVLGAIKLEFPKDWNVYAIEEEGSSTQLDIYMYPGVVRAPQSTIEPYAFRLKLEKTLYTKSLERYQKEVEKGRLTAKSVTVSGITGTRLEGEIQKDRTGVIILLPVRDKTLYLWTESNIYLNDFNGIVERISVSP